MELYFLYYSIYLVDWLQWAISLPSELSALTIIMHYWTPNTPEWVYPLIVIILLFLVNCIAGVQGFGEVEYWLSFVKVIAVLIFILTGLFIDIGVGSTFIGFQNWMIPGAPIKNGISGLFDVFLIAFFAFGGTELVGMTAAEAKDPIKTLPKAISQTFWRILLFYILSIFVMGLVIRHDDQRLLNPSLQTAAAQSPFTLVFTLAGLPGAAHVMNAVVASAILSASNSAMYAASRTLMGLSLSGHAPSICSWLYRGIPIVSLLMTCFVGSIAFLGNIWVFF